ncbi:acyltransferase family protein [Georgenia sp. SYP-B2076]|uniref:acyltransferase family protein n=1 Tax=Georgenia sp. SYP-B2076 TaxID=2495881 RepID=UPI000F8DF0AF|nr:acyltransferase family protein [Georgenia sp. SYP-B2076]
MASPAIAAPAPAVHRSRTAPRDGFRPDIEGLRAVAAGLVVLGHAGVPFLPGGYVGVDIFFVISGFLITSLLLREVARTGRVDLPRFYARRVRRLLPAAVLVVVTTVVGAWFLQSPLAGKEVAVDGLWTLVYALNIKLAADGTDYLNAQEAPSLLQHYWSLAVEEQFYLLWPVLLVAAAGTFAVRRARSAVLGGGAADRARRGGQARVRMGRVAVLLVLVVAASLALSVWQTGVAQPWAYFGLHTRAWELAVGALLAVGLPAVRRLWAPAAVAMGWAGLGAVVVAAVTYDGSTAFPGYAAALPVGGAAAIIAAGAASDRGIASFLALRPLTAVGGTSYGWYLWHWPALTLLPAAFGLPASLPVLLGAAAFSLVLAALTLHLVENPVRLSPSLSSPADGLALGFAVSSVVALVGVTALVVPGGAPRGERVDVTAVATAGSSLAPVIADALAGGPVPQNLTPRVEAAKTDLPASRADGCHADLLEDAPAQPCVYGDGDAARTVVLFGDSHADQWQPAIHDAAAEAGWKVVHRTKSACTPATMTIRSGDLGREYTECDTWREEVLAEIGELRPDLVVMGASYGLGDDDPDAWAAAMTTTTTRLTQAAGRVVLIEDIPVRSSSGPDCVAANLDDVDPCAVGRSAATPHADVAAAVREAVTAAGAGVVDPLGWFCTDDGCPEVVGNYLVHRDATHATASYVRFLTPWVAREVGLEATGQA